MEQNQEKIWFSLINEGKTGEKFERFYGLLTEYNEKFNLTRIVDKEDCKVKHFLDSISGERFFPKGASVAEIGSGGGFPSVPLMIVREDLKFTLIESSEKKGGFLREVCKQLDLNAEVYHLRAEEAARTQQFREKFDVCCARAVARLNTLSEYCIPFVKKGGRFIAYKGKAEEEISEAGHAFEVLGVKLVKAEYFTLPDGSERAIIVAEKVKGTPDGYPRGRGKERSKPL